MSTAWVVGVAAVSGSFIKSGGLLKSAAEKTVVANVEGKKRSPAGAADPSEHVASRGTEPVIAVRQAVRAIVVPPYCLPSKYYLTQVAERPLSTAARCLSIGRLTPQCKSLRHLPGIRQSVLHPRLAIAQLREQIPFRKMRTKWSTGMKAVGPDVTLFKPGDEVFYAGSIQRQGTNSEFHLVDERIVGRKPKTLSFAQAAALPLTSITSWELLFDRLGAVPGKSVDPRTLLIVGGAGGVGSILIQLARRLTDLTVVATASRPDSQKWCLDLGAHAVIDHSKPMKEQVERLKVPPVALVASLTNTDQHYKALAKLMAPQGKYGLIDDPPEFNVSTFKGKAISIHWESMFPRSSFQTPDMIGQHHLLNDVTDLIGKGVLRNP